MSADGRKENAAAAVSMHRRELAGERNKEFNQNNYLGSTQGPFLSKKDSKFIS